MSFLLQEYRLENGCPDLIYNELQMCYDKTRYAVYKHSFDREKILLSCLHDFLFQIHTNQNGDFIEFSFNDSNECGLFSYHYHNGSFQERIKKANNYLNNNIPVFVETIHPLLPFSIHYNAQFDISNYHRANHIFAIVGKSKDKYIYFDTSSYKSPNFTPYSLNPELGMEDINVFLNVFRKMFHFFTVSSHIDSIDSQYDETLKKHFIIGCDNDRTAVVNNKYLLQGIVAIESFFEYIEKNLPFSLINKESGEVLSKEEIIYWRIKDMSTRRNVMAYWERLHHRESLASSFEENAALWSRLCLLLRFYQKKGQLDIDVIEKIKEILIQNELALKRALQ